MASESTPPPPEGGGARYAIAGVALAALALLGYCLLQPPDAPTPPAVTGSADAGVISRSTALVEDEIVIPDDEPDGGPLPDAWSAPPPGTHHPSTHVAAGDWDCTGEIDSAAIRRVFETYNPQIRNCYERGLKANPMLQGAMTLQIKVGADGRVQGTQVSGSLRDRDVFSCVRQISTRMQFPHVSGGACAVVQVPYAFTPQQ